MYNTEKTIESKKMYQGKKNKDIIFNLQSLFLLTKSHFLHKDQIFLGLICKIKISNNVKNYLI